MQARSFKDKVERREATVTEDSVFFERASCSAEDCVPSNTSESTFFLVEKGTVAVLGERTGFKQGKQTVDWKRRVMAFKENVGKS